jgi:PAS domain S-box-containing protein
METSPPLTRDSAEFREHGFLEKLSRLHETVMLLDRAGRVLWMSAALRALCGGTRVAIRRPERTASAAGRRRDTASVRARGSAVSGSERVELTCEDGAALTADVSSVRLGGAPAVTLAIVRPVDEATTTRAVEPGVPPGYFRAILEASPEAVLAVDGRGWVTYANRAFGRLLGRPLEDVVARPVTALFGGDAALEAIADALRPEAWGATAELRVEGGAEGSSVMSVCAQPIRLGDGSHAGSVVFLRDITERRRSEEQLARKNDELEHYVHAVSHDLRTPLVSLLGFSRLLAQDYGSVLDQTGRHFLERIEQASRTMESLINDLLELSRIGRAGQSRIWVDPLSVLKQLSHELKPELEATGTTLVLPDSPPPILCVRTQLYQVFSNLIGNALDHMGDVRQPRIEVGVREAPDAHVVCVCDNGIGIPPEHQQRVFEIFQTLGRAPRRRKGTGIGLAIVKKIAEAHGGAAWLESEPSSGAAFFVSFPRR